MPPVFDQANTQLDVVAQHLIAGDIRPQDYLDFRGDVFQDRRTRLEQLEEDSVNLPSEDREALRRTLLAPAEQKYLAYQEIQPEIGVNGLPDFDTYFAQRDAITETLTPKRRNTSPSGANRLPPICRPRSRPWRKSTVRTLS